MKFQETKLKGNYLISLNKHKDERGFFREIFRFPEQFEDVVVGQLSHSLFKNGVIKAWHGHVYQSQWNYVVSGQIKVTLYGSREKLATYKERIEFIAGDEAKPLTYFFPPGVLHGLMI